MQTTNTNDNIQDNTQSDTFAAIAQLNRQNKTIRALKIISLILLCVLIITIILLTIKFFLTNHYQSVTSTKKAYEQQYPAIYTAPMPVPKITEEEDRLAKKTSDYVESQNAALQNIQNASLKILDNPDILSYDTIGETNIPEITAVAEKVQGTNYPENNIPFQSTTLYSQFLTKNLQSL